MGTFIGDGERRKNGHVGATIHNTINSPPTGPFFGNGYWGGIGAGGGSFNYHSVSFDNQRVVPTSHENRPASLSVNKYIAY